MMQSETIAALAAALAKAQSDLTNPVKNCEGKVKGVTKDGKPYEYTYRYADLASVLDCIRPAFAKNGIAIMQLPRIEGNALLVETRFVHCSGEWIATVYPACMITGDHQKMGGALTYAKRYALLSMAAVCAEDDLDGAHAEPATPATPKAAKPQQQPKGNTQAKASAPGAPAAERNAEPARGGYGRQKNNVDAVGAGPSGHVSGPDGEPTAETLFAGFANHEGLRDITNRVVAAGKNIEDGAELPSGWAADTFTLPALNDAYDGWESWWRALRPKLSEADAEKVVNAAAYASNNLKKLEALVAKRDKARAAAAREQGCDPETGEVVAYEARQDQDTGDTLRQMRIGEV
jgi:hypothetical protein